MTDQVADDHQSFVFKRELDQVYLLLDHISMNSDKHLPGTTMNGQTTVDYDFVRQIAKIKYPPSGGAIDQAEQATTLLVALDALNRASAPATGFSVAFTLLVSGEEEERKGHRGLARLEAPTRLELATGAFPTLVNPARRFTLFNTFFIWALAVFFLLTCLLSWNIATGNALLGQLNTLAITRNDIAKQIAAAEVAERSGKPGAPGGPATVGGGANARPIVPFGHYCDAFTAAGEAAAQDDATSRSDKTVEVLDGTTGLPLCVQRNDIDLRVFAARNNLRAWLHDMPWAWIAPRMDQRALAPLCKSEPVPTARCYAPGEIDAQWAGALLNVVGGAVLPICYGLLGAGAAVIRGVAARIRASVLTPRDLMLGGVQLVLGAVIGGCIGLFITPAGASAQGASPSLLGSVQLSASALCFIAGFGVEGVFLALESLVHRVFNIADPSGKPAPAATPAR